MKLARLRGPHRRISSGAGLPYRIRVPLAKLQERKNLPREETRAPALGDGEQLESMDSAPDYVRLALTSRVYDLVTASSLQYAPGLSHRLGACVHFKREDLLPSFSYKIRGAFNLLDSVRREGATSVVTYSVGGQGHSLAVAASALGMQATIVLPERTPRQRRSQIERAGANVVIHGSGLEDAKREAQRLAREDGGAVFCHLHDDVRVISGNATCGLEIVRQHSAALDPLMQQKRALSRTGRFSNGIAPHAMRGAAEAVARANGHLPPGTGQSLDAIFVCTGGGSLIAGVAAIVKQLMPGTKVIGVEPEENNLMQRSLLAGHRPKLSEPSHFVDGAAVQQLGSEVFRLCDSLVDDVVTVSTDEICAAVRDCFEDTRAMLEPAGAISVAGLKRWLATRPAAAGGASRGNYVVISSDASCIEFDILRFISERASYGEQTERLYALKMPDRSGMFYEVYKAVQPRWVTEFIFRHEPSKDAVVYMSLERPTTQESAEEDSRALLDDLRKIEVHGSDVTANEMAKTHARYLAGARPGEMAGERLIRFEFPEHSGSLAAFLSALTPDMFLTLLHYRNHGGQVGKVLAGVKMPANKHGDFDAMLDGLGVTYFDETENEVFKEYMA
mmetsp:Transcript_46737/g.150632  ORF Transcript_46737/g.150632 Transcript_46737/m.150632 type:complete len:618 (-) Transcript_46737:60-1913(-)